MSFCSTAEFAKEITLVFTALALNATWTQPLSSLQPPNQSAGIRRLGVGAWIGIAIACLVVFALLVTLAAHLILRAKKKRGARLPIKSQN